MMTKIITFWQNIGMKKMLMVILIIFLGLLALFIGYLNKEINNLQATEEPVLDLASESIPEKIKVDIKGAVAKPGVYAIDSNKNIQDLISLAGDLTKKAETKYLNLNKKLEAGLVITIPTLKETTKSVKKTTSKTSQTTSSNNSSNNSSSSSGSTSTKKVEITVSSSNNQENKENASTNNDSLSSDVNLSPELKPNVDTENEVKEEETEEILIVNINTAGVELLTKLNGIGPAKAQAIIDYRTTNGLFKTIEEIQNVKGIGEAIYGKIKEFICI